MNRSGRLLTCSILFLLLAASWSLPWGYAASLPLRMVPTERGIDFGDTLPRVLETLRSDTDSGLRDCGAHWGLVYCRWSHDRGPFDVTFEFVRKRRQEHLCRVEMVGPSLTADGFDRLNESLGFLEQITSQNLGSPTQAFPLKPADVQPGSIRWARIWEAPEPDRDRTTTLGLGRSESGDTWFPVLWIQSNPFLRSRGINPPGPITQFFDRDHPACF